MGAQGAGGTGARTQAGAGRWERRRAGHVAVARGARGRRTLGRRTARARCRQGRGTGARQARARHGRAAGKRARRWGGGAAGRRTRGKLAAAGAHEAGLARRPGRGLGAPSGQGCALGALSLFSTQIDLVLFMSQFLDIVREPDS